MYYRIVAWALGFRAAYDVEDGRLVVFHDNLNVHFYSWRDAVRFRPLV